MMSRPPLYVLASCLLAGAACSQPSEEGADPAKNGAAPADAGAKADRAVQVDTIVLRPETFEERIEVTGSLEAEQDAKLSAQSAGTVQSLLPLGTDVKRGQVIAQLDTALLRAAVQQAQAQLEAAKTSAALAEDNYKRQEPLHEEGVISALEFENLTAQRNQAVASKAQAQAGLASANKQLANARVVAPFTGTVEQHFVETGEQVAPGAPIVRVTQTGTLKVAAGVPERYAADVAKGASVAIEFSAYGITPRDATLTFVGNTIDPQTRTFQIEAQVDNSDRVLKPEMVARLKVTRKRIEDALTVPLAAVLRDETGTAVFVVDRSSTPPTAVRRSVTVEARSSGRVVLGEGVQAGDEVVVSGQSNLTRGDRLKVARTDDAPQARSP